VVRQLNINSYKVYIILGNNECERHDKRLVILNISLRFLDSVVKNHDDLKNTVCYDSLLNFIDKKLKNTQFRLVEGVAEYIYDMISEYVKNENILKRVEIIKPYPLLEDKLENSSFICSDW
jgi:FolB domain-containing protein